MQDLSILFEELLNENPNQAIKFLKEKNLDPATNARGKKILDDILNITKGDGYTFLLLRFFLRDRTPLDEIQKLHEYLRYNKEFLSGLPEPVINYESYGKLKRDIEHIEGERVSKRLYNQLSPLLKQQVNQLSVKDKQLFKFLAVKFEQLPAEKQRHFMKKVFGFKDVNILIQNIDGYIKSVEAGNDYESTKIKISSTPDATLIYDNPETEMLIVHIKSFDASKRLGCTSAWCITKDLSRYHEYKAGGNFYFFIWDYKYPVNDPNFFIATAYSQSNPDGSRTHEHTNDGKLNFKDVITSKNLNYQIFDNYIKKFKIERNKSINTRSPFLQALKSGNTERLISIIQKSNIHKEYGDSTPYVYRYDDKIHIGIKEKYIKEILDIGDDYQYIEQIASPYNSRHDADNDELNYMHGILSQDNINLLIELAKKVGYSKNDYDKFSTNEGAILNFLEKYDFDSISDAFIASVSEAQDTAERNAANELLDQIPFIFGSYDDTSFKMEVMLDYYIDNGLKANNFDQLMAEIKEKMPDFSYDSISDARYNDIDYDQTNRDIKEKLEEILEEIENDEDNPYYEKARLLKSANEYLVKIGFETLNEPEQIAQLVTKNMKVIITDVTSDYDENDNPVIMVDAFILGRGKTGLEKNIKVPLKSLKNYIDQYEFQNYLKEQLERIKHLL